MRKRSRPAVKAPLAQGQLRIIGGQHRGRKLSFPALEGVRPTPDRVRETLFNWLATELPGATCLDLFAGSGALGLEALSRGAKRVEFVDSSREITGNIREQLSLLKAENGDVFTQDATTWLTSLSQQSSALHSAAQNSYDIVFMDPPFHKGLLGPVLATLIDSSVLNPGAKIYLEAEAALTPLPIPPGWTVHRHKVAGQVQYCLLSQS